MVLLLFVTGFSFDIDGTEWTGLGKHIHILHNLHIFLYYMRNRQSVLIRHHRYCLCGTVFGAGSATGSICNKQCNFPRMNNISHLCKMFLLYTYGRIAPLGQTSPQTVQSKLQNPFSKLTVGCIMPAKPYSIKSRFQDMRRAFADTKMTGCTLLLKVFPTDRAGGVIGFSFCMPFASILQRILWLGTGVWEQLRQ